MTRVPCPQTAFLFSWLVVAFAGCATPASKQLERSDVGAGLQEGGHAGVRPEGAPATAQLPPGVSVDDGLDETEAAAIALWNNAGFQENLAKLGLARADLAQAGMLANPTLSMLFPVGPKQLEFTATLPLEALWLRPKRVAIATVEAGRVGQGLVQSGLDLVRDVKVALADLALAAELATIAGQTLRIREQITDIAATRVRLGDASQLDLTAARAELERAREEADRFRRENAIGRERMSLLLGWPVRDPNLTLPAPALLTAPLPPLAALEAKALAARPDLRASELALEAAGRKCGLADAEVFTLSGMIDANAEGREGFEFGPGLAAVLPIFHQNQPARLRAQAELERAAWNYAGTRQRIVAEVREARMKAEQAAAALAAYEAQVMPPFAEVERMSRRAYELGDVSPLVVRENSRQLLLVQVRRAELRAALRRAAAELERGLGMRLETFLRQNPNPP